MYLAPLQVIGSALKREPLSNSYSVNAGLGHLLYRQYLCHRRIMGFSSPTSALKQAAHKKAGPNGPTLF
jgi:hypothetical protein